MKLEYRIYRVRKPSGGFRTICAPSDDLKEKQREIKVSLESIIAPSPFAHAFIAGRNTVTNALPHRGKEFVLNTDVKNFFPSCDQGIMLDILRPLVPYDLFHDVQEYCFLDGGLPQGAPTSPTLSNLYLSNLDLRLGEWLRQKGYTYTRYADDMTVSGCAALKAELGVIISMITAGLDDLHLRLNPKKIKLMPYFQRQVVTGLVVNNEHLTIAKADRDRLFEYVKGKTMSEIDESTKGFIAYIAGVDPRFHEKLCKVIKSC